MFTPLDIKPRELSDAAIAGHVEMVQTQVRLLFRSSPFVLPLVCAEVASSIAATVHFLNVNAGWWHDINTGLKLNRSFPELLMLTVSEIGEGWQGVGLQDDKLPHRPMLEVEIADTMIRVFDWIGAGEVDIAFALASMQPEDRERIDLPNNMEGKLLDMISDLTHIMESHRKVKTKSGQVWSLVRPRIAKAAAMLLLRCIAFGYALRIDVVGAFCEKFAFNQIRSDHKPENRRQDGGKAY